MPCKQVIGKTIQQKTNFSNKRYHVNKVTDLYSADPNRSGAHWDEH